MHKLLGNLKQGLVFIVSAPAGTGKTTLVDMLTNEFECVKASVSSTTRKPRTGEVPGAHYHFLSNEEFEKKIEEKEFLEFVKLYGYYYGTSRERVREQQNQGKHVVLTIDTQGALNLRGNFEATYIFIEPPSQDELRKRLTNRQTETAEVVEERLAWAENEMKAAVLYDYVIVNDNLGVAYQALRSIIIAEEHKVVHRTKAAVYSKN